MDRPTFTIRIRNSRFKTILYVACCIGVTGCGDSAPTAPTATTPGTAEMPAAAGPGATVHEYLEAVRAGDAGQVNALLTSAARQKTAEMNIAVAPTGSDTAQFEVGQVRFLSAAQQAAHVNSVWTELDETGNPQSHAITWILRQESVGWRVAGMMGEFVAGQGEMVFNFEDPEQVIRQRDASEAIMQQQQDTYQAQTVDPNGSTRR